MANNTDTGKNRTTAVPPDDAVHGRTHNSESKGLEQADGKEDISAIDRQEGNLHPGETGGSGFGNADANKQEQSR